MTKTPRIEHAKDLVEALKNRDSAIASLNISLGKFYEFLTEHSKGIPGLEGTGNKACGHTDYFCGCPGCEWDE